jgi:hypothetical protein
MDRLTINQIMLLLDIYRGTLTQASLATIAYDHQHLVKLGLIGKLGPMAPSRVTAKGDAVVLAIKQSAVGALLIHSSHG